jgi:MFS superfamily sulfate permease-like transporter
MQYASPKVALAGFVGSALAFHLAGGLVAITFAFVGAGLSFIAPRAKVTAELERITRGSREVLVVKVRGPLTFLAQGKIERVLPPGETCPRLVLDLTASPLLDGGGVTEVANVVALLAARDTRVVVATSRPLPGVPGAEVVTSLQDALDLLLGGSRATDIPSVLPHAAGWA